MADAENQNGDSRAPLSQDFGALVPVKCLSPVGFVTASRIEIVSNFDNLHDLVRFGYLIYDDSQRVCLTGEIELRGEIEYTKWDATREGAYRIVAEKLQIKLV